ncbi:MAG: hypothetical protein PQJ59_14690 [Spirochaetales bacterium]|nr:hypothetical protein [Spirochaetales bacterium]
MGRRKRPVGRTIYSIPRLLDDQPAKLKKNPAYSRMVESLIGAEKLLSLRFNRRCYSLLHNAVIKPEHLENFYRTYRLPRHPFFPMFLALKRSYLEERERARKEREQAIARYVGEIDEGVRAYWNAFSDWERRFRGGKNSITHRYFYPSTLKKARAYSAYSYGEWCYYFRDYLELMKKSSTGVREDDEGRFILNRYILNLLPPPAVISLGDVKRHYRKLSLVHHPDRGGEPDLFMLIRRAYGKLTDSEALFRADR